MRKLLSLAGVTMILASSLLYGRPGPEMAPGRTVSASPPAGSHNVNGAEERTEHRKMGKKVRRHRGIEEQRESSSAERHEHEGHGKR
jgi:hypothetical protein